MDLLLFQIGPVQDFIAQAATPEDLWAGSYLLSSLMKAGLDVVPNAKDTVIFPNLKDGRVEEALGKDIPTLPNRFWTRVPEGTGTALARKIEDAIRSKLRTFAEGESAAFRTQLEQFLSISWATRPETEDKGADYKVITRQLAIRRNLRDFKPWREEEECKQLAKDFLSGKESALSNRRGAMNLIKQKLIAEYHYVAKVSRAIKDEPYYAVIAFDGDRMGATLSSLKTEEAHRQFSQKLVEFALKVEGLLSQKTGERSTLVYAGGDDVLAVVPAKCALDCAEALRQSFTAVMGGEISASMGIAVGHCKAPFQDLVKAAQAAEHRAKEGYGRDAVAITVMKRSGETLEWGFKWHPNNQETAAVRLFRQLNSDVNGDSPSARFPYKLAAVMRPYGVLNTKMKDIIYAEVEHAWKQSVEKKNMPIEVARYLDEVFELGKSEDFLNLFMCETFIDRPREMED